MPGRWNDDAEREEQYWRRERQYDEFGLNDEGRDYQREGYRSREARSFDRDREDRVFGQNDYGAEYNRPRGEAWQRPDYGGASPAMRRGDYDTGYRANPRFSNVDYTRGGRFYGDDGRGRIYREEYGQGGYDYGPTPRGYDEGRRFGSREADQRYAREMNRYRGGYGTDMGLSGGYRAGTWSGGTGGYDYERGYGDAGRSETRYGREDEGRERFEDRAREAGDFFRRTGQKISSWFEGVGREDRSDYDRDRRAYEDYRADNRGARGLGPKGYKRSDERISEEVHQRLTDDPWVDATNISASVSGGEVTLSGTVETREAKHRAERIVEDLSGVTHVQNNLRIQPGNYFTSAGRGYGDSVQAAQMRKDPLADVTDGKSDTPQAFQQAGSSDDSAATRTTTRRT
jgi:osmotically-inducible protein OsmY